MKTKDKEAKKKKLERKEPAKSTMHTNDSANDVNTKKASDKQAKSQTEFEDYGQAGNRMTEQEYGEDKGTDKSDQPEHRKKR